ncbi:MAG: hypothetical protein JNK47_10940 [Mesorhizobium sp.]|nr:hypothetical protein [Mesorhizobium sp.]MBL8577734.1 hypothetical protein [Mesorhizobium sp.]
MATADELNAQLTALKKARASGALVIRHGDTQVTYRSIAELQKAIDAIQNELDALTGKRKRGPRYVRQDRRGL